MSDVPDLPPTPVPDLGQLGKSQRVQVIPAALVPSLANDPLGLMGAQDLLAAIRAIVVEELDRRGLTDPLHGGGFLPEGDVED